MPFARALRLLALGAALSALTASVRAQATTPEATGRTFHYEDATKESIFTGNARLVYKDIVLTADEIRYSAATNLATATGNFVLTYGKRRLVADHGTYNLATKAVSVRNLRLGEFPVYLSGESVEGTLDELVFTNATVFFRENAGYTPSIRARKLTYARGKIVRAEGLGLGLLGGHFLSFPHFEQALDAAFVSYISGRVGYRGNLGAFAELGLHVPVATGVKLGADVGLYSSRGVMVGPSGTYQRADENGSVTGSLRSGYIYDAGGNRKNDILGVPVPHNRSYLEWQHQQRAGDHFTLNGEFNYWSDSEILRDFNHKAFDKIQQPDSFIESAYTGDNYSLSAFARFHPNAYHRVQERLPEVRFDLMPVALPLGFTEKFSASAAVLQADAFGPDPKLRTNRLDAYYGLARTIAPTPWFAFTPVAGARVTHYTDALGGKDTYTRQIGEVGFDARLLASGTFDYKNPVWAVDGLRHLVEPKLSYRYAPEADRGRAYIPPIDRRVFSTYLQPLSIGDSRNLDDLTALNTVRLSLDNILQTRDPAYGSRNLVALNFAADYRFDRPTGTHALSDIYTEFALTPAPWLRWEVFHRFNPNLTSQQELNTGLEIVDQEWWSAKVATHFLKNNYEEYTLEYRQRLNEVYDATALWRYDARNHRFNEQSYGVWQRLGQTWAVKYEVSWFNGPRRESSFAMNIEVELLKF
ncbi:MAG: LPS assembly protein LptD [Lacunisphaera sp.]|nr:LPS assembly protein LptD [Lacunisphaera sp.]